MSDSVKKAAAGVLLALGFALVSAVILPLYVLPLGFVWVIFLVWLHVRFGPVPAYAGAVGLGLASLWALGAPAAVFVTATALLAVTAAVLALKPQTSVPYSAMTVSFTLLLCVIGAVALVQAMYGNIITLFVQQVRQFLEASPELWKAYSDMLAQSMGLTLTIEDLLFQLETSMQSMMPSQIVTYCLYGGVFSVLWAWRSAARRGQADRFGAKFDLYRWALPKYTATILLATMLLCYILAASGVGGMRAAAYTIWQILYALFTLQGIAFLAFTMKLRGARSGARLAAVLALFILVRPVLFLMGVFDRLSPLRRLPAVQIVTGMAQGGADNSKDDDDTTKNNDGNTSGDQ